MGKLNAWESQVCFKCNKANRIVSARGSLKLCMLCTTGSRAEDYKLMEKVLKLDKSSMRAKSRVNN